MAERDRRHIVVRRRATAEPYTRPPRAMGGGSPPGPPDRRSHGLRLAEQLQGASRAALVRREERPEDARRAAGIYVTFESFPDVELAFESLDPRQGRVHPELVAVRDVETDEGILEQATVFVPDGKLGYFLKRLEDYARTAAEDSPKNRNLVDRIASISLGSLEELWTDPPSEFPEPDTRTWWELWLRRHDGQERVRVEQFAEEVGAQLDA